MDVIAVQLDPIWQDKPANHARVRELLSASVVPKKSLIVLPEMFDTGFSMNVAKTAQTEALESESFVRELAAEFDSAVMAGVVGPEVDGVASNLSVTIAPSGEELVRYRKMQPFTLSGEDQHYGAGDHFKMFQWQGATVSPFVCYDLRFPEIFRPAAQAGADFIVLIACWPMARSEHWVRLLQARAIENQAFTLGVNRCGTDPKFEYDGRSTAFDPMGEQIFECDAKQQVQHFTIDTEAARTWREKFPALRDIRSA